MGKMIGEQMVNLRSSLDNVSKSFRKMAFDASKAGINSQKFYQIIEGATSSLSFFGNFLKTGSSLLRSFYKAGELGLKDAQEGVEGIMGAFKDIDYKKGLKVLQLMGGEKVQGIFGELLEADKKTIKDIRDKLEKKLAINLEEKSEKERREIADSVESLRNSLEKEEARAGRLADAMEAYNAGDFSELSLQVGRLAERPVEAIKSIMDNMEGYTLAEIAILEQTLGLSQKQTVLLKDMLKQTEEGFSDFVRENQDVLGLFKNNVKASEAIKSLLAQRQTGGISGAEFYERIATTLEGVEGLNDKQIRTFLNSLNENIDNQLFDA